MVLFVLCLGMLHRALSVTTPGNPPSRYPPAVPARRYSELECFVLGLVWQLGPCSPYEIRRHLQASPSSQWSASAGAIYPLIERLEKGRLIRGRAAATGKRTRTEYAITPAGLRTLRAWIGPPLAREAITVTYDPLRSRARFLRALTPAQRRDWFAAALDALRQVESRVREWQEEFGATDPVTSLITRSGEIELEARTRWIQEFQRAMSS
jgi:DNA-binding PadR family transcriptional regulator